MCLWHFEKTLIASLAGALEYTLSIIHAGAHIKRYFARRHPDRQQTTIRRDYISATFPRCYIPFFRLELPCIIPYLLVPPEAAAPLFPLSAMATGTSSSISSALRAVPRSHSCVTRRTKVLAIAIIPSHQFEFLRSVGTNVDEDLGIRNSTNNYRRRTTEK